MDLHTVTSYRLATSRADLRLTAGERVLAGGTWLFSEPQPEVTGLVDLTAMAWPALEVLPDGAGLRIAATCTIAGLVDLVPQPGWLAQPLFARCASALLASRKVWHEATVGGNVCRSFAAAGMVALAVGLDGTAEIWRPDGTDLTMPVAELVTGNGTNRLQPGEVLRALTLPGHALRAVTAYRKIALAELGRSGGVYTGRVDDDGTVTLGITAATAAPTVLRFPALPTGLDLEAALAGVDGWYTDPLGTADWRAGVTRVLLGEIVAELAELAGTGTAGEVRGA